MLRLQPDVKITVVATAEVCSLFVAQVFDDATLRVSASLNNEIEV